MNHRFWLVLSVCVGISLVSAQAGGLSGRVWFADYTFGIAGDDGSSVDVDVGMAPMWMLQFDGKVADNVAGAILLGYGQGWEVEGADDVDISRVDLLAGLSWIFSPMYIGLSGHMVGIQIEDSASSFTRVFAGPEAMVGTSLAIVPDTLYFRGSVSIPVLYYAVELSDEADTLTGLTWGYCVDVGLVGVLSNWRLGGGYRLFNIPEYEPELEGETTGVKFTDEFGGLYVMAGLAW